MQVASVLRTGVSGRSSEQLALIMIAGIWATLDTLISSMPVVNEERDVIVTGVFNKEKLSLEHRRIMFQNDWIALKFGVALTSLLFAFVLYMMPTLAEDPNALIVQVAYVVALSPLSSFVFFAGLGWCDFRFIQHTLKAAEKSQRST
jgi:hypothetical protein